MRPVAALPIVVTNSGGVHRGFSPGYLSSSTRLFQDCNLSGVVKLVLGDALEHETDVVGLARNLFGEPLVGQPLDGHHQLPMSFLHMIDGLLPFRRTFVLDRREILFIPELESLPQHDSAVYGIIPGGDVQNELPDAMNVLDGMHRRRGCIDVS